MATVYRSRIDTWLVLFLAAALAVSLYANFVISSAMPSAAWAVAGLTAAIGIGLPLWLMLSTHYTLDSRQLLVQCGPFKWRIALADITAVTPTTNPLSSPALSLDRLRIDYGQGKSLMISPRNKEQFLRAMEAARRSAG